jgi:Ca-activated chloride channel family protein
MTFAWPWMLLGLVAIPALGVAYRRQLRARSRRRVELAQMGLVARSSGPADRARHVAPVLFAAALTLMLLALARPVASVGEPRREGTVILAFDVSTSMAAKDVEPTRLDAAKAAAKGFIEKQPSSIKMGVVAFGGTGLVTQQPTTDKAQVLAAVNRLSPQGNTALGRGILSSLSAIAGKPLTVAKDTEGGSAGETPIGYYAGTAIVMLTDGENTDGPDPLELADLASTAGVRIYPIGLGSSEGSVLQVDGFSIATALDEDILRQIAQTTGGSYYSAADAGGLAQVYGSIKLTWTARTVPHEVTSLVSAVALVLLLLGAGVTVLRSGRVI